MDAALRTVEGDEPDELRRLRARAYGPDADISSDPVALARLTELEAAETARQTAAHARATDASTPELEPHPPWGSLHEPSAVDQREPVPESVDGPEPEPERGRASARDGPPASGSPSAPGPVEAIPRTTRAWWRRWGWWVALGGGAAVLTIAVSAFSWLSPRPPDYVLHLVPQSPDDAPRVYIGGYLAQFGIDDEDLRRFEDFRGFSVWSGESRYGTDCVLVTHRQEGGTGGCAADGLVPTVDLTRYQGWSDNLFQGMPAGSLVRFTLEGDHVNVYLSSASRIGSGS